MVRRRLTIPESKWPDTRDFVELAIRWQDDAIKVLWDYVWQGWDLYCTKVLSDVDWSEANDQLERMITQDLELDVRRCMSGYEPFMIQHERFEEQGRSPSPARPKQPDLTFVWYEYRTCKYPLEAKVLRSDNDVKAYVEEITENFWNSVTLLSQAKVACSVIFSRVPLKQRLIILLRQSGVLCLTMQTL